jgi:hypothetical protein
VLVLDEEYRYQHHLKGLLRLHLLLLLIEQLEYFQLRHRQSNCLVRLNLRLILMRMRLVLDKDLEQFHQVDQMYLADFS